MESGYNNDGWLLGKIKSWLLKRFSIVFNAIAYNSQNSYFYLYLFNLRLPTVWDPLVSTGRKELPFDIELRMLASYTIFFLL